MLGKENWSTYRKLLFTEISGGGLTEYTETGNPLSFNTNVAKALKSLLIPFTPTQSGTGDPSPTNVRPISGVSAVNVWQTGENALPLTANSPIKNINTGYDATIKRTGLELGAIYEGVSQGNYWIGETASRYIASRADGGFTFRSNDSAYGFGVCTALKGGESYTFSYSGTGVMARIAEYAEDGTHLGGSNWQATNPKTFTAREKTVFALLVICCDADHQNQDVTISNARLDQGSTASDFTPYTGQSFNITFPAMGKNLLNVASGLDIYRAYNSYSVDGHSIIITDRSWVGFTMPCDGNTQYTFSVDSTYIGTGLSLRVQESANPITSWNATDVVESSNVSSATFTTSADSKYLIVGIYTSGSAASTGFTINSMMVNTGATALPYEPYTNTVYGGSLDVTTGVLTVEWKELTYSGKTSEIWKKINEGSAQAFAMYITFPSDLDYTSDIQVITNYLKKISRSATWGNFDNWISNNNNAFVTGVQSVITVDDWKAYLAEHPLTVIYPVVPFTIQLTPTQITALLGDNTIWSDTNGSNSAVYLKKG